MKKVFWISIIVLIISIIYFIIPGSMEFGLGLAYPNGIPERYIGMQDFADAMQEYNHVDGLIGIFSLCSSIVTGFIAWVKNRTGKYF